MNFNEEYERWLACPQLSEAERDELVSISNDSKTKELRFASPMTFGTAGLRSTMYTGVGCMNRFTVAQATRGMAHLVKKHGGEARGVVIAYDSRNNSELFAKICASVLVGYGIKTYIFDGIRPTPELSFAVRELSCMAGINITASHNPKEYNGYKAYWEDGAQINPDQASLVAKEMSKFDVLDMGGMADFEESVKSGEITVLKDEFDAKYLDAVFSTAISVDTVKSVSDELKVVYTPIHGAGYKLVPKIFRRLGLKYLYTVDEQMIPDGNFPTVVKPNPEYAEVFQKGIKLADEVGSDIVIATDPDSDRVGVMTRSSSTGSFVTISGNQMGALLLDYVIRQKKAIGKLPSNAYCVKSIVSTDMAYAIAKRHGVRLYDVLTGFKYIGEVIKNHEALGESTGFIMGFEESYGYLFGSYARDKDAVGASMIILEMTAFYKKQNMTLSDALDALYKEYGFFAERTIDVYMEGLDGIARRRTVMSNLRENPLGALGLFRIVSVRDYLLGKAIDLSSGKEEPTNQPASDVLFYTTESNDKIIVRPSGTEPKIKIYILLHGENREDVEKKAELYESDIKRIMEI